MGQPFLFCFSGESRNGDLLGPNRGRKNTDNGSDITVLNLKIIENADALLKKKYEDLKCKCDIHISLGFGW